MQPERTTLNVDAITLKTQLRDGNGDLTTLQQSIEKVGLLHPLTVDTNNVLISGARRLAACRAANLTEIPVVRLDVTYDDMAALDIQSDENLCREALSPAELQRHIEKKTSAHKRSGNGTSGGLFGWLKRVFGNKS
jgi:ParB family chromosome partitioning protein